MEHSLEPFGYAAVVLHAKLITSKQCSHIETNFGHEVVTNLQVESRYKPVHSRLESESLKLKYTVR